MFIGNGFVLGNVGIGNGFDRPFCVDFLFFYICFNFGK